ncbi:MAG: molecular chaperone DnaJ [Candidatus Paceibacterota bacterium]|jgi:molecular chaperone DnaJ
MAKDYYKLLEIEKGANKEEIKKAFHKLAHKYHPDKKGGNEAKFKEINEAYQILSDDKKRAEYDRFGTTGGASGFQGGGFGGFQGGFDQGGFQDFDFGNLNDIFSEFFTGGMGRGRAQERRGRDISTELNISFYDSIFGIERNILLTKVSKCETCKGSGAKTGTDLKKCSTCNGQGKIHETKRSFLGSFSTVKICEECGGTGTVPVEKCSDCKGSGIVKKQEDIKITIPAGMRDGEMIRITGEGEAISKGASGDLYIKINVAPHPTFKREGSNLIMDLNLKLSDALLGTEYKINTLDGDIKVRIPEGVGIGEVLRVKEKGVPVSKNKRGDLFIRLHIKIPNKLSKKAKELVEKMKEEGI